MKYIRSNIIIIINYEIYKKQYNNNINHNYDLSKQNNYDGLSFKGTRTWPNQLDPSENKRSRNMCYC